MENRINSIACRADRGGVLPEVLKKEAPSREKRLSEAGSEVRVFLVRVLARV